MSFSSNTILERNPDIICSKVDDEIVMMNIVGGTYFGLDTTGAIIWELLEEPLSLDQLIKPLVKKFEISQNQCENDCMDFFLHMLEKKILFIKQA